eukprot:symbB.v1.2.001743.t2/scaffold94.1/size335129/7
MARVSRKLSARRRDSRDPSDVLRRSAGKGCCCPNCRQERQGLVRCSPSMYSDAPSLAVREFAPQLRVPDLGREASSRPVELDRLDREPTCFPSGVHLPPAPPSEDAVPLCSRLALPHDEKIPGRSLPPPPLLLLLLDKAHGPLASQKEEARPQSAVPTELACKAQSHVAVQAEEEARPQSHAAVQAEEEEARPQSHAAVQAEEACKAQSHVAVQAEEEARPQSHAAVQAEEACKAQSHVAVQAEEEARPQSHAAVQSEEACTAQSHVAVQAEEALPVECSYEMDPTEAFDPEFSGVMSPPLAPSPSSSSSCEAEACAMVRPGAVTRRSPFAWAVAVAALIQVPNFVPAKGHLSGASTRVRSVRIPLRAEPEVVDVEATALVKLEEDIEAQLKKAEEEKDQSRLTRLSRLLVLTRSSAAATAWQTTKELRGQVSESMASAISEFVGKDDYDINDVATKVEERVTSAVSKLDNVYLTAEAAKAAPEGSKPIILTDVVRPVAGQMKEAGKEAVLAFTGKEEFLIWQMGCADRDEQMGKRLSFSLVNEKLEYKFGDISKEAAKRAKSAMANLLGQEEYKFGDVTKKAMGKAMDAITSFTGKEDYKFGDITKSLLRGALNYLEGDDEKKK